MARSAISAADHPTRRSFRYPSFGHSLGVTGSDNEPSKPIDAETQMREVTERLRNQAWMVAPMTTVPLLADSVDEDADA